MNRNTRSPAFGEKTRRWERTPDGFDAADLEHHSCITWRDHVDLV